jgi:hypothetical protein
MMKQEKKAEKTPILLTEAETDHVAGGDNGNHYAFGKSALPAWQINHGKADTIGNAADAPGHQP